MSDIRYGIDPTRVTTSPEFPLGLTVEDPRGGDFTGNVLKYVFFGGAAVAGDAVILNNAASQNTRHASVLASSAVTQGIEGFVAAPSVANNNYGWIVYSGRVNNANVAASAVGDLLKSTATAGRLTNTAFTAPATAAELNAQFTGRQIRALSVAAGNLADVLILR